MGQREYINLRIPNFSINSTDIAILTLCLKEYSMADLHKELGVAYKNIAPHIKKLKEFKLITIKESGRGRKKIIKTNWQDKRVQALMTLYKI